MGKIIQCKDGLKFERIKLLKVLAAVVYFVFVALKTMMKNI